MNDIRTFLNSWVVMAIAIAWLFVVYLLTALVGLGNNIGWHQRVVSWAKAIMPKLQAKK